MARVVRRFVSSHAKRCNRHSAAFVFCIYIYTHEYMHYTRFARSPVGEVSHALRGRFPYNVLGGVILCGVSILGYSVFERPI